MFTEVALLLAAGWVAVSAAPSEFLLGPQSQNLGQQPLQQGYQYYDQPSGQSSPQLPPQFQSLLQSFSQQQRSPVQQQLSPTIQQQLSPSIQQQLSPTIQQQASPLTMQQLQNGIQQYLQQQQSPESTQQLQHGTQQQYLQQQPSPVTMQQIQNRLQQFLQQQSSPVTMQQLQSGIQQYLQWQQENPQQARQLIQQLQSMPGLLPAPIQSLVQQLALTLGEGVSQGVDRLTNAIVKTFDFNYQNFDNTLNCMQGAGEKIVDSGINVLKSGLGMFLSIPRAIRNFAADPYADQNQNHNNRVFQRY